MTTKFLKFVVFSCVLIAFIGVALGGKKGKDDDDDDDSGEECYPGRNCIPGCYCAGNECHPYNHPKSPGHRILQCRPFKYPKWKVSKKGSNNGATNSSIQSLLTKNTTTPELPHMELSSPSVATLVSFKPVNGTTEKVPTKSPSLILRSPPSTS